MKLTSHYRDSLDQPLCEGCAEHSILKLTSQKNVEESPKGHDPLECAGCNNIILTVEEATAKAEREGEKMQALDTDVDPLALSDEEYEHWIDKVAWKAFLGDDIDPRKQEF